MILFFIAMKVSITGIKEIESIVNKDKQPLFYACVQKHAAKLDATMKRKASKGGVFNKGYSKGYTKKTIDLKMNGGISNAEIMAIVAPHTNYASYLEYGTRFMDPEPFVQPSLDEIEEAFIADIERIMSL